MRLAYEYAREFLATTTNGSRRVIREDDLERLAGMFMQYEQERAKQDLATSSTVIRNEYDDTELLYDEA